MNKRFDDFQKVIRIALLLIMDIVVSCGSVWFTLFARFEFNASDADYIGFLPSLKVAFPIIAICVIVFFVLFRIYRSLWEYASTKETMYIVVAAICAFVFGYAATTAISMYLIPAPLLPNSVYAVSLLLFISLTVCNRFAYRVIRMFRRGKGESDEIILHRILVVGAGQASDLLIREININGKLPASRIVCAVDDDKSKTGKYIHGIKIVGTRADIISAVKKNNANEIIFAIPSASEEEKAAILNICKDAGCTLTTLPGVYQLLNGEIKVESLHKVDIEDLLGRPPIKIELDTIMSYVSGKTVLVTGGGGSIGSELCRQIASYKPKKLIVFDIYENNAYDIQMELERKYPELDIIALIGSVRDTHRINSVFEIYRPDIVYHAAAHKHVPLMEVSPNESIKNNVFGTLKTVQAADRYKAKKFVLISTDKAVNPTNIMGATKRLCEMIVQAYDKRSSTEFVAVRFGNVLGSNGSVIPLFKKQIEAGGPVCVTHPDIIRYFMTIPEAVSLVLQAGAFAHGGEIFVLDMGKPVRILDLAEKLIRLSGYTPYVDMNIVFIGLRPGEKLFEEILMDEEGLEETANNLIHIGKPIKFNDDIFFTQLEKLRQVMMDDTTDIRTFVREIVTTYHEPPKESSTGAGADAPARLAAADKDAELVKK